MSELAISGVTLKPADLVLESSSLKDWPDDPVTSINPYLVAPAPCIG